ncbi:MAG: hypothetical protein HKN16_11440 [Saprospiraceae bacterium]|nr:hypothetical protein [Saprospiraceae bacterium]
MSCASCRTSQDGKPLGCNGNGGCATGGCNRMNTYDWLTNVELKDPKDKNIVEVSFKNGSRKAFFFNPPYTRSSTGDMVVVETGNGLDVGKVTLSGELVRLQMKKKRVPEDADFHKIVRRANNRDLERMDQARDRELPTLIQARVIARSLKLEMKIGDIEYQSDLRKATFYYTAEGRVDFRELIKHFARDFRVKVEMRQIGARQESARIGGLGSCGRELCCSTWLSNFKSVSTAAARYQNLAINQAKLSGQCGRLKCCLNYELDTYMDALEDFPKNADVLQTEAGAAHLIKTNIFKRLMFYAYRNDKVKGRLYVLPIEQVQKVLDMNAEGKIPQEIGHFQLELAEMGDDPEMETDDLTGVIELPPEEKRRKKRRKRPQRKNRKPQQGQRDSRGPKSKGGGQRKPKKRGPGNQKGRPPKKDKQ